MNLNQSFYVIKLAAVILFTLPATPACAHPRADDVTIEVLNDNGKTLPQYPASRERRSAAHRRYIEARRHERYGIRVRNRTNQRIGLVIAVDGRNIISGDKSHLKPDERMYILGPHEQAVYKGWRTDRDRIHRFYFTNVDDSYAGAWGDRSAIGVIAVASYRERQRPVLKHKFSEGRPRSRGETAGEAKRYPGTAPQPGTGFGEEEWSPAYTVHFEPDRGQVAKYFIKYEWRQALCTKGIVACGLPKNRFWPERDHGGYAPHPPRREG